MTNRKFVYLAPLALAVAVSGCGRSEREQLAADYCPQPFQVQDVRTLTRFAPGAGRDPRNVVFEAELLDSAAECSLGKRQMNVNLVMRIAVTPGPAATRGTTSVPYFVRVIDGTGRIVQGQEFNADFDLSPSGARRGSKEELSLTLPFEKPSDAASYRIAVGLKPTPEELDYNRSVSRR
ncbi:MAG: hypothetical protein JSR91_15240 [Proteobacteria bacterium]|nr:hypothetical protein [Pseudomonadota bacterium]